MAKASFWPWTDAEARKRGERTGLDTLVVHAVNDVHWVWVPLYSEAKASGNNGIRTVANAISAPPGEYARKGETQRN